MKKMFMAVIALMMTISASAQFYIYYSDGTVAKVDSISMIAPAGTDTPDTPIEPEEPTTPSAGIGVFSVSDSKQVTFSPGNLQYTQSTNTWSFAENQWDYLGEANIAIDADVLADKVDLFGWSTSNSNFGVNISMNSGDYAGNFVDWGTQTIGTDTPNTWRTLTNEEWSYILNTRDNAIYLYGVAQVNGMNGLILLPDNWTCPTGISFKSGFSSDYTIEAYGKYQTFTVQQWSVLESTGAVFLPASGSRSCTYVHDLQNYGDYWSATKGGSDAALYIRFYSVEIENRNSLRFGGRSVRLVKDL